jgi:hypothetical protein
MIGEGGESQELSPETGGGRVMKFVVVDDPPAAWWRATISLMAVVLLGVWTGGAQEEVSIEELLDRGDDHPV